MSYQLILNRMLRDALVQVQRLPRTDIQTAVRLARVSLLRANAELLKGAMAIVEHELSRAEAAPAPEPTEPPQPSPKKSIPIE
ncbi:hypothetical protein [Hyalangium gracile]|uniref:hypothetical protein n=1 Tax=Hyalangium gracile TaxID=394092 RepID=UPI001CCCF055|nr:hypothetical protein [Hyalangium gracile]